MSISTIVRAVLPLVEISLAAQSSILRVIQERGIIRIGETTLRSINVRILVATNRDLLKDVKAGRFREDLYYRISGARIRVPSLRERIDDIPLLANTFIAESSASIHKRVNSISPVAMAALKNYDWPGNVRELRNVIELATITCSSQNIGFEDIPPEVKQKSTVQRDGNILSKRAGTYDNPREQLLDALRRSQGHRSRAAELLGISRATLYRRLGEYGLDGEEILEHLRHTKGG